MPRLTLIVPEANLETAKLASQAFDSDVGGYFAFSIQEADGRYSYTVDASQEYYEAFKMFKIYPEYLLSSIQLDFEQRFPDASVPTLQEVTDFCNNVEIINLSNTETIMQDSLT